MIGNGNRITQDDNTKPEDITQTKMTMDDIIADCHSIENDIRLLHKHYRLLKNSASFGLDCAVVNMQLAIKTFEILD